MQSFAGGAHFRSSRRGRGPSEGEARRAGPGLGGARLRLPTLLLVLCSAAPLGSAAGAAPGAAAPSYGATGGAGHTLHPTDGPDADVRLSVEEGRVRVRIDANLAFCDQVVDVPRELDDALAEVEVEPLARGLFAALAAANRVRVDGVEVDPLLHAWRHLPHLEELEPLFPLCGARALIRVRLELEYPLLSSPRRVSFLWGVFPIDTVARQGLDGPPIAINAQLNAGGYDTPLQFTVQEPEFVWHGEVPAAAELFFEVPGPAPAAPARRLPLFPLVGVALGLGGAAFLWRAGRPGTACCAAAVALGLSWVGRDWGTVTWSAAQAPTLDPATALAAFEPLHQNIYRAFGFDDEERVYDALARSVDGPLLEQLYLQVYRSLVLEEEGGAVSRVQAVRTLEAELEASGPLADGRLGFTVRTRWQVDGAVFHYGHAHRRTQEYLARYTVAEVGTVGWRIVGNEVLEQTVVATAPGAGELPPTPAESAVFPASREL
jgi:hypothetical protein